MQKLSSTRHGSNLAVHVLAKVAAMSFANSLHQTSSTKKIQKTKVTNNIFLGKTYFKKMWNFWKHHKRQYACGFSRQLLLELKKYIAEKIAFQHETAFNTFEITDNVEISWLTDLYYHAENDHLEILFRSDCIGSRIKSF